MSDQYMHGGSFLWRVRVHLPDAWFKHKRELSRKKKHFSLDVQSRSTARFSFFSASTQVVSVESIRLRELHWPSATIASHPILPSQVVPSVLSSGVYGQASATSDVQLVAAAMVATEAMAAYARESFILDGSWWRIVLCCYDRSGDVM